MKQGQWTEKEGQATRTGAGTNRLSKVVEPVSGRHKNPSESIVSLLPLDLSDEETEAQEREVTH